MAKAKKNVVVNSAAKIITVTEKVNKVLVKVHLKPGRNSKITDDEMKMLKTSEYFKAHKSLSAKSGSEETG